jgi:hypothetical protein
VATIYKTEGWYELVHEVVSIKYVVNILALVSVPRQISLLSQQYQLTALFAGFKCGLLVCSVGSQLIQPPLFYKLYFNCTVTDF